MTTSLCDEPGESARVTTGDETSGALAGLGPSVSDGGTVAGRRDLLPIVAAGTDSSGDGQTISEFCSPAQGGVWRADSEQEFRSTITGRWVLCSEGSPFGDNSDEDGIEMTEAGSWHLLSQQASGKLVRIADFDSEGTYEVLDTTELNGSGWYQLDLTFSGGEAVVSHPSFSSEGRWMRISNNAVFQGDYRKLE